MIKCLTAGYSRGGKIVGILDGLPSGIKISRAYIRKALLARRSVPGRGARQEREDDAFEIVSGLKGGGTDGSPVCVILRNRMVRRRAGGVLRPGHADLPGVIKYNLDNPSLVRERASARETAVRCALYSFCRKFLEDLGMLFVSGVMEIAGRKITRFREAAGILNEAKRAGKSAGGIAVIRVSNVPPGLGSHVQGERKLSSAVFSEIGGINSVKGVEIGDGFAFSRMGDGADALVIKKGRISRETNRAGGIEGGISNGEDLLLKIAVKPVPGSPRGTPSFDWAERKKAFSVSRTSDITSVFAVSHIAAFYLARVLAEFMLEKFGGDSFGEIKKRVEDWRRYAGKKTRA